MIPGRTCAAGNPDDEHDLVVLHGRERNLNWREYVEVVLDLASGSMSRR